LGVFISSGVDRKAYKSRKKQKSPGFLHVKMGFWGPIFFEKPGSLNLGELSEMSKIGLK